MNKKMSLAVKLLGFGVVVLVVVLIATQYTGGQSNQSIDELVIHNSPEYSFKYPAHWFLREKAENENTPILTTITNYDPNVVSPYPTKGQFKIEIVKLPNEEYLPLKDWVDRFIKESPSEPVVIKSNTAQFAGYEAIYNVETAWGHTGTIIYISKGDYIYGISSSYVDKDFQSIYDEFIQSFAFNS